MQVVPGAAIVGGGANNSDPFLQEVTTAAALLARIVCCTQQAQGAFNETNKAKEGCPCSQSGLLSPFLSSCQSMGSAYSNNCARLEDICFKPLVSKTVFICITLILCLILCLLSGAAHSYAISVHNILKHYQLQSVPHLLESLLLSTLPLTQLLCADLGA